MKRLRALQDYSEELVKTPIKYYMCGEYGTQNWRPHYHAIIFNVLDKDNFAKAWQYGNVVVGSVTSDSIAYTLKYIDKDKRVPVHSRDDRLKEFSLMSKKLGDNYVDKFAKYHKSDYLNRYYLTRPNGVKVPMPRYYRDKIFSDEEKDHQNEHIVSNVVPRMEDEAYKSFCKRHPNLEPSDLETYHSFLAYRDSERSEDYRRFNKSNKTRKL